MIHHEKSRFKSFEFSLTHIEPKEKAVRHFGRTDVPVVNDKKTSFLLVKRAH